MRSRASLVVAALLAACGGGERRLAVAPALYTGYDETGLSSWYGEEVAGNRTASGERFDPMGLTAAHRTLPLGSLVEVTALATGRTVVVRINDRGPGRRDRLIDLSRGAARLLGADRQSLSPVRIRALALGEWAPPRLTGVGHPRATVSEAPPSGRYLLQIASFSDPARARALAARLGAEVATAGALYRVRLGPLPDAHAAQQARDAVVVEGYADAQLIPLDTDQP